MSWSNPEFSLFDPLACPPFVFFALSGCLTRTPWKWLKVGLNLCQYLHFCFVLILHLFPDLLCSFRSVERVRLLHKQASLSLCSLSKRFEHRKHFWNFNCSNVCDAISLSSMQSPELLLSDRFQKLSTRPAVLFALRWSFFVILYHPNHNFSNFRNKVLNFFSFRGFQKPETFCSCYQKTARCGPAGVGCFRSKADFIFCWIPIWNYLLNSNAAFSWSSYCWLLPESFDWLNWVDIKKRVW